MSITHVKKIGSVAGNSAASIQIIPTSSVAGGNAIEVKVSFYVGSGSYPTATVTDTKGNTYSVIYSFGGSSSTGPSTLIAVATNITGLTTSDHITISFTGTAPFSTAIADEINGMSSNLDGTTVHASGGSGTSVAFGTLTTTNPNDYVSVTISAFGNLGSTTWSSGWSTNAEFQTASPTTSYSYQIPTSAGSFSGTATLGASEFWNYVMVAYKAAGNPKTETLIDKFNQNSLSGNWSQFTAGSATMSYSASGVQVNYPSSSTSSTDGDITSSSVYDLTGSYVYAQILSMPSSLTHADAQFGVQNTSSNRLEWLYEAGTLYASKIVSGAQTNILSTTYNPAIHKWLRIRESGGTTYWDYSSDGINWTNFTSQANPITVTGLNVILAGTCYENETNPGTFMWNNFNIVPSPVGKDISLLNNNFGAFIVQAVNRSNSY